MNHLANVQEAVSDKKFAKDLNEDDNRDEYRAATVMVYDYYPFGELMPGRSLDTSGLCVTYNNYMEIPSYRYNDGGTLGTGGGGGATPYGADTLTNLGTKGVSAHGLGGGLVYTITGITDQSIQINTYFHYLSGTDTITAWLGTNTSSTGTQLGSTRASYISPTSALPISVGGTVASPATITLVYKMANGSSRALFSIDSVNYTTLSYTLVTSTFSRCGDPKDKYEFGFNGQMKSNEIAGVGNHYTFPEREYDPRISKWWIRDPHAQKYPGISPYVAYGANPISLIDPDGRDLVYFNMKGDEVYRRYSRTEFRTFVQTGIPTPINFVNGRIFSEAPMPKIIQTKGSISTTDPQYQRFDYSIAAETFIFNANKNKSVTPAHTNGSHVNEPNTVPNLDPTLVKATIMQESTMGTSSPRGSNDPTKDIMQANVFYSESSNDWADTKTQFGLLRGKGAEPQQSIRAGIGIMYQKGLKTEKGITTWDGGATWDDASKKYNGGGAANYDNVIKMRDGAKPGDESNYVAPVRQEESTPQNVPHCEN